MNFKIDNGIRNIAIPLILATGFGAATIKSYKNDTETKQPQKEIITDNSENPLSRTTFILGLTSLALLGLSAKNFNKETRIKQQNMEIYDGLKNEITRDIENTEEFLDGTINHYDDITSPKRFLMAQLLPDKTIVKYEKPFKKKGVFGGTYIINNKTKYSSDGKKADYTTKTTEYGTKIEYLDGKLISEKYPSSDLKFPDLKFNEDRLGALNAIFCNKQQFQKFADIYYGETGIKRNYLGFNESHNTVGQDAFQVELYNGKSKTINLIDWMWIDFEFGSFEDEISAFNANDYITQKEAESVRNKSIREIENSLKV